MIEHSKFWLHKTLCIATIILLTLYNFLNLEVNAQKYYLNYSYDEVETLGGSFKAWMDYRCITNETSTQYLLQTQAYTDENGLRKIDDYFLIAVGNYYADYQCGKIFEIILDSNITFLAMVGEVKADKDTDKNNQYCIDEYGNQRKDSLIEFIVDSNLISDISLRDGDIREFDGNIVSIIEVKD